MLEVISNGSKWAGEKPDTIEDLLNVLDKYVLDPTFESYGNFIIKSNNSVKFFGNFLTLSHVFNIVTDELEIINKLSHAINQNQERSEYKENKIQIQRRKENKKNLLSKFNKGEINQKDYYKELALIM